MIPEPKTHASGEKKILGEALSAIREEIRDSESGMANPASVGRFRTPTGNSGIHENFVRAAVVLADRGQRLPRSSLRVSDLFRGCAGRPKPGSFGDSFWRRPWPCAVRTRPLPRRGYCDARRRFVNYQICNT